MLSLANGCGQKNAEEQQQQVQHLKVSVDMDVYFDRPARNPDGSLAWIEVNPRRERRRGLKLDVPVGTTIGELPGKTAPHLAATWMEVAVIDSAAKYISDVERVKLNDDELKAAVEDGGHYAFVVYRR